MQDSLPGAGALSKALNLLDHLALAGPTGLSGLVDAVGLPRATTHRLASALLARGLLDKDGAGAYRLGGRLVELGRAAARQRPVLAGEAVKVLERLRDETGESTQLFVAEGDRRVCLVSIESPHSLRTIVAVGASLPMDRGSAGRALGGGEPNGEGWVDSVEEREVGVASVSAPVLVHGEAVAAVSLSGPVERLSRTPGSRYGDQVVKAARALAAALL